MNFGFIIDNRKCIGCHACTVACKSEHDMPLGVNRTWVKYIEKGEFPQVRRIFSVMRCNHCADAPCVDICPVTALYTREDGIVDFDNRRCIGCKACMQACPYDALYIDPSTHTAAKCNYCAHRVDLSLEPACVNVCPEHAIISGDLDNPLTEISQLLAREQVTARKVEKGTRPKLFYIDADDASLKPGATEQSSEYVWSSQATGVGHFAQFAEERMAKSDPAKMQTQLASSTLGNGSRSSERDGNAVNAPDNADRNMPDKAQAAIREQARRAYDVPGKGILWGWEVSAYVWTKAIAAGVFLIPFLARIFGFAPVTDGLLWSAFTLGLLFLSITGALLVIDLDKPSRFIYVLLRPQWTSWLVRGGYAILLYGGFLTLWGLGNFFKISGVLFIAFWGCALFAVITAVYTAFLFAQAKGRDFWQSPILSLHMLGHATLAGSAVFAILGMFTQNTEVWTEFLQVVFVASIGVNLVVLFLEVVSTHPTNDAERVVQMIVSGQFKTLFWFGTLVIGNVLPLALLWFGGVEATALAGVLALAGIYITEHIWIRAPQLIPLS